MSEQELAQCANEFLLTLDSVKRHKESAGEMNKNKKKLETQVMELLYYNDIAYIEVCDPNNERKIKYICLDVKNKGGHTHDENIRFIDFLKSELMNSDITNDRAAEMLEEYVKSKPETKNQLCLVIKSSIPEAWGLPGNMDRFRHIILD